MNRRPGRLRKVAGFIIILGVFFLTLTVAFYLTEYSYRLLGWQPHELVVLFVNAIVGLVLLVLLIFIAQFLVHKHGSKKPLGDVIDALQRISRGDYHVNLNWGDDSKARRNKKRAPFFQLVDSINDMAANLKEMEELRQEFISNVSHEIGSPLASIRGFAKALMDDRLEPEKRQRYLTIIETECVRLSELSDNLLKLAMLDADRYPYHPAPYRLDKQLVTLILACEPQWEEKNIDMNLNLEQVEIRADEALMSQVWVNLIHNAVKFTPPQGKLSMSLTCDHEQAIACITDSGPGIAEDDQTRIFERFYMADKARDRSTGGSGLGLAITKKIVSLHQGSIAVCSIPGEGAQFTVTLPLAIMEQ